jgi:hypothetical protein
MKKCIATVFSMVSFVTAFLIVGAGVAQATTTLPTPCQVGINCLQFGDFNVYSLPLLDLQNGGTGVPKPGTQFFFSSTYGAVKNDTIIGINNGNCTATGNPPNTSDCSYNTPSKTGSTEGSSVFSTQSGDLGKVLDPGPNPFAPEFTGDTNNSWDITTSTLLSQIGATPLVAFFAFNETGGNGTLEGAALLTWAEVTLVAKSGNPADDAHFFLSSNNGGSGTNTTIPSTSALPPDTTDASSPALNPWVYVHAGICTSGTAFVGFPDATGKCPPNTTFRLQNNLGQNAAAFAITSPALDAALNTNNYSVMQVTWKMAYIDGGGETAWIAPLSSGSAPEPGTLANLGLGLIVLAFLARRRRAN